MKKILQKAGILFLIFIGALVVYFISARNTMEKESAVYTSMEEPSLPVVYTQLGGQEINCLHGYMQDMGNQAARESISVLPEDRGLHIRIEEYGNTITGISYEVRNLTLDRLVERTEVEDWENGDGSVSAVLPIQNLLARNETYLLSLTVSTGEKELHYYTRIMWPDNTYASDMVRLAQEFTRKSLDYNQARDLVSYLETNDTEDNSSLGHVTIRASFSHLTWDGLDVEMVGEPQVTLQEFDGIMGQIQIRYQVAVNEEDGTRSIVDAEDNFTMKWNELRIYMMQYDRTVNQIFSGDRSEYSGKRILLGITGDDRVELVKSAGGKVLAYRVNRDLWSYDPADRRAVKVFSFRDDDSADVRSNYDHHDTRILSVEDDGDMDFLVYGYMNRGNHEGENGIAGYHYTASENALEERYFIPYSGSYEQLEADLDRLTCQTAGGMLYLYVDHAIYGIDMNSRENMVVADSLAEGTFAVSSDKKRIAWQEGTIYESGVLHLMDLETGENREIRAGDGEYVRTLGFVGRDLVYGMARADDIWLVNGRTENLPMYSIRIINDQMQEETSYEKNGYYISEVTVDESRIHLKRVMKTGPNHYADSPEDTIVCNADLGNGKLDGIGWFASPEKERVYFVQLEEDATKKPVGR